MEEDFFKCYKCRLKDIVKNPDDLISIENLCKNHNTHLYHVYQFLRLYLLNCYHNNEIIPLIDEKFLVMIFKILSLSKRGQTIKNKEYIKISNFYDNTYSKLNFHSKINSSNQQEITGHSIVDIIKNINNNIILNFENHLKKFINHMHIDEIITKIEELKILKPENFKSLKHNLYKELNKFKNDVLKENVIDGKYLNWFNENKNKMLPINFKSFDELLTNTQSFLKPMIFMNLELEKKEKKLFQFFPLKNGYNLGFIKLETHALSDALVNKNNMFKIIRVRVGDKYIKVLKKHFYFDVNQVKKYVWDYFFKTNLKIFKNKKKYSFDYAIITDGVSVSLRFIENEQLIKSNNQKLKLKNARENARDIREGLTEEEIAKNKEKKLKKENELKIYNVEKTKITKKIISLECKIDKTPNEKNIESLRVLKELYLKKYKTPYKTIKPKEKEFKYLEEMNTKELSNIKSNYIVIDPGKRTLLQMLDYKKSKFLSYSNHQRTKEIRSNEHTKSLLHLKKINNIEAIELELSKYSKKSCNIETFKKYISYNNLHYLNLQNIYQKSKCRVHKWYRYLNTKRSENNLINNIKKTYGKDINILIGDWSKGTTQMKNFKSTPRIGLKRVLKSNFNVYDLNEFRTSKMCYYTHTKTKNLYVNTKILKNDCKHNKIREVKKIPKKVMNKKEVKSLKIKKSKYINDKNKKIDINKIKTKTKKNKPKKVLEKKIKLHAVLSYKMKVNNKPRMGCINRDKNACFNMLNIVETYLINKTRPSYLSRKIKCN